MQIEILDAQVVSESLPRHRDVLFEDEVSSIGESRHCVPDEIEAL